MLVGMFGVYVPACEGRSDAAPVGKHSSNKEQPDAVRVPVVRQRPETIERRYRTSGTLSARRQADVIATQLGVVERLTVEEGDRVERGQVLARLDGRELALQAAMAELQAKNLQQELERLESAGGGIITDEEISKQRYAVEEARVSAKLQRVAAKQTIVRAPFSGTIVERHVDPGSLASTATPLVTLADLSALELELHIPEREAATLDVGTPVELVLVDESEFIGVVDRIGPIVDPLSGTVKATVKADTFPKAAKPGAFVRASIVVDRQEQAPSVPRSAVFEIEDEWFVFVIRDGVARRQSISRGLEGTDRVAIVSGLGADDLVVRDGNSGVTDGMPLVPVDETNASS